METTGKEVNRDTVIGDIIKERPEATKVIEKYFGNGCFTCPGINVESIAFGATRAMQLIENPRLS